MGFRLAVKGVFYLDRLVKLRGWIMMFRKCVVAHSGLSVHAGAIATTF